MRHIISSLLLFLSIVSFGQKKDKFSLLLQIQPELTFHKNDYAFRWSEKKNVSTFNIGLNASLQYKLTERLFIDFGFGYISRKLNTKVFLDQSLLPPPYYDSTKPLYVTKSVAFRPTLGLLQFGLDE
jgi:outer membrane protein assembly factor BamA